MWSAPSVAYCVSGAEVTASTSSTEGDDLAHLGAKGGAAADRVARGLGEHEVEVGTPRPDRGVAREPELLAGRKPAVLAAHDRGVERAVELGAGAHRSLRGADLHPV